MTRNRFGRTVRYTMTLWQQQNVLKRDILNWKSKNKIDVFNSMNPVLQKRGSGRFQLVAKTRSGCVSRQHIY